LQREDAEQREHDLRKMFNELRYMVKTSAPWRWMPNDLPPWAAVYQQTQAVTNDTGELTWIDQGHTGERAASAAAKHGIALEVVKLPEASAVSSSCRDIESSSGHLRRRPDPGASSKIAGAMPKHSPDYTSSPSHVP